MATNLAVEVRGQLQQMEGEFRHALPAHIPVARFMRVVMTALQRDPDLLRCDRKSLFGACMSCAQDGLLPDGREAAFIAYKSRATYLPMIAGIRKKVRNSGEVASWESRVVHENDAFEVIYGDNEEIRHTPNIFSPGKPVAAYSIARLKDGTISREVMSIAQINAIRARAAAKGGPWETDFEEMARKTVLRRHSKSLPLSTDLDDLIRRDDALYDLEASADKAVKKPTGTQNLLEAFAEAPAAAAPAAEAPVVEEMPESPPADKAALDGLLEGLQDCQNEAEVEEYAQTHMGSISRLSPPEAFEWAEAFSAHLVRCS